MSSVKFDLSGSGVFFLRRSNINSVRVIPVDQRMVNET